MLLLGIFDMFTACDGKTAWAFLPFLLVAGLLGYLLKHFMGSNHNASVYQTQLTDWQTRYNSLQAEYKNYQSTIGSTTKNNDQSLADVTSKIKLLEATALQLTEEKNKLNLSLIEKQNDVVRYTNTTATLEKELNSWKEKNASLETQLTASASLKGNNTDKELAEWKTKYDNASTELSNCRTSYAALEAKLALVATPKRKDDLTKIEGIGPVISNVLNDAGISSFEQLANTTPERIQTILHAAGPQYKIHDPSTLTWPRQAKLAAEGKWEELKKWQDESLTVGREEAPKAVAMPDKKDDLTKIEGIGPKINSLLNEGGIYTFNALANASYEQLKNILDKGGERFRMHDPTTWPKQSKLAAESNWDALKKLQAELKGGRP
jgi:predicted flap endonuclease-1-like 5' DNA nuclease